MGQDAPEVPQHVAVRSEYDVVSLRQQVRQMARLLGLSLPQQARITAAISSIARALLDAAPGSLFTIQVARRQPQPALEIICILPGVHAAGDRLLYEASTLADEASVLPHNQDTKLTLRMWLTQ